jgi:hypothetical protein
VLSKQHTIGVRGLTGAWLFTFATAQTQIGPSACACVSTVRFHHREDVRNTPWGGSSRRALLHITMSIVQHKIWSSRHD